MHIHSTSKLAVTAALTLALLPSSAYATTTSLQAGKLSDSYLNQNQTTFVVYDSGNLGKKLSSSSDTVSDVATAVAKSTASVKSSASVVGELAIDEGAAARSIRTKVLSYNRADIDAIGNQNESGHTICCPSFSCAYADAVLDGTVHDHSYYTCFSCTWQDWGGGGSWNRSLGSDEEVLREAYDQICAGKPTVVHVAGEYTSGHWIALIGFVDAEDPDHLSLANFIALDPTDGQEINAAERYHLYGDGCQHVSDR